MTTFKDLKPIREAIKGYEEYRRRKGLDVSDYWRSKVAGQLHTEGFPVRQRPVAHPAEPRISGSESDVYAPLPRQAIEAGPPPGTAESGDAWEV